MPTITDRKLGVDTTTVPDGVKDYYIADMVGATHYYPFGIRLMQTGRSWQATDSLPIDRCISCTQVQAHYGAGACGGGPLPGVAASQ